MKQRIKFVFLTLALTGLLIYTRSGYAGFALIGTLFLWWVVEAEQNGKPLNGGNDLF